MLPVVMASPAAWRVPLWGPSTGKICMFRLFGRPGQSQDGYSERGFWGLNGDWRDGNGKESVAAEWPDERRRRPLSLSARHTYSARRAARSAVLGARCSRRTDSWRGWAPFPAGARADGG